MCVCVPAPGLHILLAGQVERRPRILHSPGLIIACMVLACYASQQHACMPRSACNACPGCHQLQSRCLMDCRARQHDRRAMHVILYVQLFSRNCICMATHEQARHACMYTFAGRSKLAPATRTCGTGLRLETNNIYIYTERIYRKIERRTEENEKTKQDTTKEQKAEYRRGLADLGRHLAEVDLHLCQGLGLGFRV